MTIKLTDMTNSPQEPDIGSNISPDCAPAAQEPETKLLLPLAITLEDEKWACVAGIDAERKWLRPSPIPSAWGRDPTGPFRYRAWTRVSLSRHPTSARPEDRAINGAPLADARIEEHHYRDLLLTATDPNVEAAFAGERSAGLVRANIEDIYARRHTRGRTFLRLIFHDGIGNRFDWIVPEVATNRALAPHIYDGAVDRKQAQAWLDGVNCGEVFLAVGLTLPNDHMPGRFRGCHPLVVGVHRLPSPAESDGAHSGEDR
jgi:hypothetical protein